jgi:hypothetical protein
MTETRQVTDEIEINVAGAHPKHTLMMWSSVGQNYVVATAAITNGAEIAGHLVQATQGAGKAVLRLLRAPGTAMGIAAGSITEGQEVTAAAAGQLAGPAGAGCFVGVAMESASANDVFEYRPYAGRIVDR